MDIGVKASLTSHIEDEDISESFKAFVKQGQSLRKKRLFKIGSI